MTQQQLKLSTLSGQYVQILEAPSAVILLLVVGVLGNLLALHVLRRTRNRCSNRRHVFMLRCLFVADCLTLACNLVLYAVSLFRPDVVTDRYTCKIRVVLLFLGLCTCNSKLLMAVERWTALTKPLFYHQYISHIILKRIMIMVWLGALIVVFITSFDLGIYWDEELSTCIRYRNAKKTLDVMYAYMIFIISLSASVVVVYTNFSVLNVLSTKDNIFGKYNTMKGQVSIKNEWESKVNIWEEKTFSWLIIFLCITFVSCWGPYVILIPLNRFIDNEKYMLPLNSTADLLIMMHGVIDPCLYLLLHWNKSIVLQPAKKKRRFVAV